MGMGGGGQTQSQSGSGWSWNDSEGWTRTTPTLYNWRQILPPWVSSSQEKLVPFLMNRAQTGMTPQEEQQTWGQAKETIEGSSQDANKALSRVLATSGIGANSPAAVGGYTDLAGDKMTTTTKAALDFVKMKMGAKDTALGQLMTALYSPSPSAIGHTTDAYQQAHGASQNTTVGSSGGGGK